MPRLFFAPVDLVEDRTRTRLAGVCAIFTMYLFIGAPLVTRRPDPPYVLTSSVTFASALPGFAQLGPTLTTTGGQRRGPGRHQRAGLAGQQLRQPHLPGPRPRRLRRRRVPAHARVRDRVGRRDLVLAQAAEHARLLERLQLRALQVRGCDAVCDDRGSVHADAARRGRCDRRHGHGDVRRAGRDQRPCRHLHPRVRRRRQHRHHRVHDAAAARGWPPPGRGERYLAARRAGRALPAPADRHGARQRRRAGGQRDRDGVCLRAPQLLPAVPQGAGQDEPLGRCGQAPRARPELRAALRRDVRAVGRERRRALGEPDARRRVVALPLHHVLLRRCRRELERPGAGARAAGPTAAAAALHVADLHRQPRQDDHAARAELRQHEPRARRRVPRVHRGSDGRRPRRAGGRPAQHGADLLARCERQRRGRRRARAARARARRGGAAARRRAGDRRAPHLRGPPAANDGAPREPPPRRARLYGSLVAPEPKHLIHAVSAPTGDDGVASFPELTFGVWGLDDGLLGKYHRLAFCTPGVTSSGVYDGCAVSCPIKVQSRVVAIAWSVQPTYLRTSYTTEAVEPGEPFLEEPIKPVVRFVDEDGQGVPSKKPYAFVMDMDAVVAVCAALYGVTLTDADLTSSAMGDDGTGSGATLLAIARYSCVGDTLVSLQLDGKVALTIESGVGQTGLSGPSGFVVVSSTYSMANPSYMFSAAGTSLTMKTGSYYARSVAIPGDAVRRSREGRFRLLVADATYTKWSLPSEPFSFSVPHGLFTTGTTASLLAPAADASSGAGASAGAGVCTSLTPLDTLTSMLLGPSNTPGSTAPTRRPDPLGGRSMDLDVLFLGSGTAQLKIIDTDSWLVPLSFNAPSFFTNGVAKIHVQTLLADWAAVNPAFTPSAGFASQPDYLDVTGDLASIMGRIRQAILGDFSCDDPSTATNVTCALSSGGTGVCPTAEACVRAQFANDAEARAMGGSSDGFNASFPGIKLLAQDATGRGVPGLRVRLNVIDVIYPNLPPVATIVTCGLVRSVSEGDSSDLTIEGLKPSEVSTMRDSIGNLKADGWQDVCVTDANGVVEMRVLHPYWRGFGVNVAVPEYIKEAATGSIRYEYAAYVEKVDAATGLVTSLSRACEHVTVMDVESRMASIEWGVGWPLNGQPDTRLRDPVEQQRTAFDHIQQGGSLGEKTPTTTDLLGFPSNITIGNTEIRPTINPEAAVPEHIFCFDAVDVLGEGVPSKMLSYDLVHLPSYLPGWTTELDPACLSYSPCDLDLGSRGWPPENGGTAYMRVEEYGWSNQGAPLGRLLSYPYEPYATFITMMTGSWNRSLPGVGCFIADVHAGHPCLYGVVVNLDGIRSSPLLFNVRSRLASIAVHTEPSGTPSPLGRTDAQPAATTDVVWRVKSVLAQPPRATLLDDQGAPVPHYQVFAQAVDPDTLAPLPDVVFDMIDAVGTSLEGVFHPMGSARSSPADSAGLALFDSLQLFDAANGTRFRLKLFFRVTAPYEDDILAAYGATAVDEVSVVTTTTCVAINNHKLTVVSQPSAAVSLGSALPATPSMYFSLELEPYRWTSSATNQTYDLWRFPQALLAGMISLQLVPAEMGGEALPYSFQATMGALGMFSGSRCAIFQGLLGGNCTLVPSSGARTGVAIPSSSFSGASLGYVVGGVSVPEASAEAYAGDWRVRQPTTTGIFAESTDGVPPVWVTTVGFPAFTWEHTAVSTRVGAALEVPGSLSSEATFRLMSIESEASSIELVNDVPAQVAVGASFVLMARVTISSGMPLASARVTASTVAATGVVVSPAQYILNAFNIKESQLGPDPPTLNAATATGMTDADGVVRLVLEFVSGVDGDAIAVRVGTANGVASERSRAIVLRSPLSNVSAAENISGVGDYDRDLDFTKLKGVGKKGLVAEAMEDADATGYASFPIVVALENISLSLALSAIAAPPIAQGDVVQTNVYFRLFTRKEVDRIRDRDAALANLSAGVNGTVVAGEAVADGAMAAVSSASSGNLSVAEEQLLLVLDDLTAALEVPSEQLLSSFVSLLVSGSGPQHSGGTSANAQVLPTFVVSVVAAGSASALSVSGVEVKIDRPGEYYLQPVSAGVPGPLLGPIKAAPYDSKTAAAIALDLALKIFTTFVVVAAAIGSSDWHDWRYGVPVGLAVSGSLLGLSAALYPIEGVDSIGLWYILALIMMAATLFGLLGELAGDRVPGQWARPFSVKRKERYFAYCRLLVHGAPSEATKLMAQLRARPDLATRLYLERRLEMERRNELSWRFQLHEVLAALRGGDRAAFFFPTRIFATFTVSIFANAWLMRGVLDLLLGLAASVRDADARTIAAVRNSITLLQAEFRKLAGADLPAAGGEWALANVKKLHGYMVSLADAIEGAAIGACVLGLLFFVAAWLTMMLDFRAKVIQARRGIWSFNVSKVKLKHTFTYFGAQVSNGMMTFALISLVLFPVLLLLAWSLTWDVLIFVIEYFHPWLIALLAPIIFNVVVKMVVTKVIGPKQVILRRSSWMFYDLYELLLSCVTGITKALVRFCLVMVVTLFSLPRMDVSLFPAWLDYYVALDTGARAYHSLILSYHLHNNPVMRTFVWIVEEDARARRRGDSGMCSVAQRRAANMWWKLWMMHKTAQLADYTSSGMQVPIEAIIKAAKKKDVTILQRELDELNGDDEKPPRAKVNPTAMNEIKPLPALAGAGGVEMTEEEKNASKSYV